MDLFHYNCNAAAIISLVIGYVSVSAGNHLKLQSLLF